MMGALIALLTKVTPALAAKLTSAGVMAGVAIYRVAKPSRHKRR